MWAVEISEQAMEPPARYDFLSSDARVGAVAGSSSSMSFRWTPFASISKVHHTSGPSLPDFMNCCFQP